MSIWSKVLIGLIFVATLPFFYLSLRLLKTNQAWRRNVNAYRQALDKAENGQSGGLAQVPFDGTVVPGQMSLEQLGELVRKAQVNLHDVVHDRGRVWRNVMPERAFNANTGKGTVIIEAPSPHRIADKSVLFAFDANGYLGEFQVVQAGEKNVSLEPSMKPSERQLKRLSTSAGPWMMYETMPLDRHDVFAGMDKEALGKFLPEGRVDEYVKDGQPAEPNDPAARVVNGKFQRALIDYATAFHDMDRQISVATDLRIAAEKDLAALKAAVVDANKQIAFRADEISQMKQELARSVAERDLIKAQYVALEKRLADTRAEMKRVFQENRQVAQELADFQRVGAQ